MENPSREYALPVLSPAASGRREVVRSFGAISAALLATLGVREVAARRGQATDRHRRHGDGGKRGKQGKAGPSGPPGRAGIQGEKGDKGDQGDQGQQGLQGDVGDKGDKGDKGEKGDPGLQTITLTDGNIIDPSGILETSTATCAEGAIAIGGGWTSGITTNCQVVKNARSQLDARSWEVTLVCFSGSASGFRAQAICLS